MSSQEHVPEPTLFQPGEGMEHLGSYFDRLPRFLYRTYSVEHNRSKSETTPTSVASGLRSSVDVLKLRKDAASSRIEAHLTWKPCSSNFVSWTSSFVFAIQLALYKTVGKRGWPGEDPSTIQIYILDTHNVPHGSILPAVALLKAYEVESSDLLGRKDYAAEYLSQGRLDLSQHPMPMFTLGDLIKHGLLRLEPNLARLSVRCQLASRVREVRHLFDETPAKQRRRTPTLKELDIAQSIVLNCCPMPTMRSVLMAALMSFHPRKRKDENILSTLRNSRREISITVDMLEDQANTALFVVEHKQFVELMHDIYADAQRQLQDEHESLHSSTGRLHLSSHQPVKGQSNVSLSLSVVSGNFYDLGPKPDPVKKLSAIKLIPGNLSQPRTVQTARSAAEQSGTITGTVTSPVPLQQMCYFVFFRPRSNQPEVTLDQEWKEELVQRHAKDTRPCLTCSAPCSYDCFRAGHFTWCTTHDRMKDKPNPCTKEAA